MSHNTPPCINPAPLAFLLKNLIQVMRNAPPEHCTAIHNSALRTKREQAERRFGKNTELKVMYHAMPRGKAWFRATDIGLQFGGGISRTVAYHRLVWLEILGLVERKGTGKDTLWRRRK